jgi:hypothetical protein
VSTAKREGPSRGSGLSAFDFDIDYSLPAGAIPFPELVLAQVPSIVTMTAPGFSIYLITV